MSAPDDLSALSRWIAAGVNDLTQSLCMAGRQIDRVIDDHAADHPHIVIACFPKSASTFLATFMAAATGFRSYLLNTSGYDNERNIDRLSIPMFLAQPTVSQEHMRATVPNVAILKRMSIRPVVLVRNIFDCIISSRDHARSQSIVGPNAHVPHDFASWPIEAQDWFIVRMGVPWYLTFFASWMDASNQLPVLWLTYESLIGDPVKSALAIADHVGISLSASVAERSLQSIDPLAIRLNTGVSGRGERELSPSQMNAVRETAGVYRGYYDLSMIGLK
ncbi:MAG TPA: sulfotransferase domain-containing protein [Phycisphaerales bacterium]|nr:sulfotransferase domain-containing protein [Phycisphaerales bacterium]